MMIIRWLLLRRRLDGSLIVIIINCDVATVTVNECEMNTRWIINVSDVITGKLHRCLMATLWHWRIVHLRWLLLRRHWWRHWWRGHASANWRHLATGRLAPPPPSSSMTPPSISDSIAFFQAANCKYSTSWPFSCRPRLPLLFILSLFAEWVHCVSKVSASPCANWPDRTGQLWRQVGHCPIISFQ